MSLTKCLLSCISVFLLATHYSSSSHHQSIVRVHHKVQTANTRCSTLEQIV